MDALERERAWGSMATVLRMSCARGEGLHLTAQEGPRADPVPEPTTPVQTQLREVRHDAVGPLLWTEGTKLSVCPLSSQVAVCQEVVVDPFRGCVQGLLEGDRIRDFWERLGLQIPLVKQYLDKLVW
jgi:hypothetical protein